MQEQPLSVHRPLFLLAFLVCFSTFPIMTAAQIDPSSLPGRAASARHVLYAPLAGMQEFDDWDLVILNRDVLQQNATIRIYSSDGKPYPPTSISLTRTETRHIDARRLLPANSASGTVGGITLEYYGPPMAVAARVVIRGFHGFGNLDVPLLEDEEFKSNTLAAIWWEPAGARSYLVLGNSSDQNLHADIAFSSGTTNAVDLAPFVTRLEPFPYTTNEASADGRISSVQITYSGEPGSLRAAGFSTSLIQRFFDSLRFVDPKLSTEATLYANGLHLSDLLSHLLVKNISAAPIAVAGVIYPLGPSSFKPISVPAQSFAAGESGELQLPPLTPTDNFDLCSP